MTSPPISIRSTDRAPGARALWPLGLAGLILAVLWGGPLPELARVSFSAHMVLHLGLIALAAPLAALGFARLVREDSPPGGWVLWAVLASVFELVVVWGWHVPGLHEAAAFVPWLFAVQQASFLVAGALVWLPGLVGSGRGAAGAGVIAMGLSFMHMSMLGVLLTTAPVLIYPEGMCGGAFGLSALADQRIGGVMMAVLGGAPYLAGTVVFAHRLLTAGPTGPRKGEAR